VYFIADTVAPSAEFAGMGQNNIHNRTCWLVRIDEDREP